MSRVLGKSLRPRSEQRPGTVRGVRGSEGLSQAVKS